MSKQFETRSEPRAAASLEQVKQTAHSDLQYVSLQVEGKTYGGWYRLLSDGRMELLALANMNCERRPESSPIEQARGMLADFIRAARPPSDGLGSKQVQGEETQGHAPATLGSILYADGAQGAVAEAEWVALVKRIASGDSRALYELFTRGQRLVFTLIFRLIPNRDLAEELTIEVFRDAWQQAPQFDPAHGTVLGWIMNLARFKAITYLGQEQERETQTPGSESTASAQRRDENEKGRRRLHAALHNLSTEERRGIEAAYLDQPDQEHASATLQQPQDVVAANIHSGLAKLRDAFGDGAEER